MSLLAVVLLSTISIQVATPLLAGRFIDRATTNGAMRTLIVLALVTIGLAVIGQLISIAETWVAEFISWEATNSLRADLAAHLLRLDASFHNAHTPGELIERVDGDVSTLARFFSRFVVYVLGNGLLLLGVLGLLLFADWRICLGMSVFVAIALVVMLRIRAMATPYSAIERQESANFYGFLGEYLGGLEDVRSNGAGGFVLRRCAELMRSWLYSTKQAGMRGYGMVASSQGLFGLGLAFALALSAMLYRDGSLTIGAVYLIFRYTSMLRQPTEQIRNEMQDLQQADASLGRIASLLREEPKLLDGPGSTLPKGPLAVEFDDVWFGYSKDSPVLRKIDVRIEAGRVLGVVGRTGSGKTSLTRLLPRFHDPITGVVRLGGIDIRDVRIEAVRSRIGLVSQEVHLFQANVRDNLTLFDDSIPDARILEVLREVGMGHWLGELSDGLDTQLGAGGAGLSAGQEQILACARVMLLDPDVVILDEASSRLDPATERMIHVALGRLLEGRTGIIVAHRLSTFAYADDIVILEQGEVSEYGIRRDLEANPDSQYSGLLRLAAEGALV